MILQLFEQVATSGGTDWKAAKSFDRMQDLVSIRVPALIVAGMEDALTPVKYARYLATEIAGLICRRL